MVVWGPRFLGERSLRIWLPDGSPIDLRLHLPEAAKVPALGTTGENPSRDARSARQQPAAARNLSGDARAPVREAVEPVRQAAGRCARGAVL